MADKLLRIHGRVQGVYYRAWTVQTATALGLKGWVRNRADGTVEVYLSGDEKTVLEMINACYKGPPAAKVTNIDITNAAAETLSGFEQKASA